MCSRAAVGRVYIQNRGPILRVHQSLLIFTKTQRSVPETQSKLLSNLSAGDLTLAQELPLISVSLSSDRRAELKF